MSDTPTANTATIHVLTAGYYGHGVASTVGLVRDGVVMVVVDPGMVSDRSLILDLLSALGILPHEVTDVVFSHHHPDHTINAALFPAARYHDRWAIYQDDVWTRRDAEGFELSPSIKLIRTPGHSAEDMARRWRTPLTVLPRSPTCGGPVRDRPTIRTPAWSSCCARSRHRVVAVTGEAVLTTATMLRAHAVTLPFRLATIHRGAAGVVDMLRREYGELVAKLDRLSGHVELGVKVYVDSASPSCPSREIEKGQGGATDANTSGRHYLQLRKEQQRSRDKAWQMSAAAAAHADTELSELAVASRHHRPHQGQLCPDRGDNVLNAAYLVDVGLVETFTAKVKDLDRVLLGARVEVTGPWAPYSFVGDDGR